MALLLPLLWLSGDLLRASRLSQERAHVESDLAPYAHSVFEEASELFASLRGLASLVSLSPPGDANGYWPLYRTAALEGISGVQQLIIAPEGVIQYVFPSPPPGLAVGENLLAGRDSEPYASALRAVRFRNTSLTLLPDPTTGRKRAVVWVPVERGGNFWGLLAVQVDLGAVFGALTGPAGPTHLAVAVRDAAGRILYGQDSVFAGGPVVRRMELPEGYWEIAAVPEGGWGRTVEWQVWTFWAVGLALGLLFASVVHLTVSRQSMLEAAVRERTREIHRINDELKEDVERRKGVEAKYQALLEELGRRVEERTHHLSALYAVTAVSSSSLDLTTVLERSLDQILEVMGCEVATVHLSRSGAGAPLPRTFVRTPFMSTEGAPCRVGEPGRMECWVLDHDTPLVVGDTAVDPRSRYTLDALGPRAHAGVPIRGRGGAIGALCVFREQGKSFSDEEVALLEAIAYHLGVAIDNAHLFSEAQGKAVLEERQRLARELHDSVTQLLYSSVLMAEAARRSAATGNRDRVADALGQLGETAQQALKEMRLLVYQLRPLGLERGNLAGALERRLDAVEKRAGIKASVVVHGPVTLPPDSEEGLFFIAQEALNNALKHARADAVVVEIGASDGRFHLRVVDNGVGFDPQQPGDRGGMGLTNMRERAEELGGSLVIHSAEGQGTVVSVSVPLGGPRTLGPAAGPRAGNPDSREVARQ